MSTTAELCAASRRRAQEAPFRIEQTKENVNKCTQQGAIMSQCTVAIKRLDVGISSYAILLEVITSCTDEGRRDGNTAVMSVMCAAAYIVPSCDDTIIPHCEDGETWFEIQDGIDISRLEGSRFRSILSAMMRSVVLRANPQSLRTLVLDEISVKLSVENSAMLFSYLPVLAQGMQTISIEQKPEVFVNNSHTTYKFFLDGDHTVVQKEDVAYDRTSRPVWDAVLRLPLYW